jgi:hypothetical protein
MPAIELNLTKSVALAGLSATNTGFQTAPGQDIGGPLASGNNRQVGAIK